MVTGILVLELDSSDLNVIGGVFRNLKAARDYIVSEETERAEGDDISDEIAQLDADLAPGFEHEEDAGVSLRIESPFITMDLLFQTVEVRLGVDDIVRARMKEDRS